MKNYSEKNLNENDHDFEKNLEMKIEVFQEQFQFENQSFRKQSELFVELLIGFVLETL